MATSSEASWQLDGMAMFGTFTRPDGPGPFPAVVFVAGSGPTDRDWTSPLIAGTNGSARLLAEELAAAGIASLRYDKRASGPHMGENVPKLVGRMSMQSHLDELAAAVGVLAATDGVDASRIAGFGNSEGCIHVLHYAVSDQRFPLAGLVLTAPPGRPLGDVLLTQLALQLSQAPGGSELLPLVQQAAARYSAGEPMDADPALPETVRMVLASFETPANLPFARELWSEDVAAWLGRVRLPVLVLIGGKDLQVDARLDGEPLQRVAQGMPNVSFVFPAHANHVLKEELRDAAEVAADLRYNDADARLDPEAVAAVRDWLQEVLG